MINKRKKPIKITDTTLRDGHQSLWATRMRLEDILPIAEDIDRVGYHSVEVWGGATFDVCLRYLNEDPWVRLKKIKEKMTRTPLQMLLRGQNIVGYKNYPDDLLEAFIQKSLEHGIDIFRIFDALNDIRNVEKAIEFVIKYGGRAQGAICYTRSPIHTIEKYIEFGKKLYNAGATSINIKDMSGILTPYDAYNLVLALKAEVKLPLQLHCHSSSGMATAAYVKAVEAGVDIIDCAAAPLALYTSQPAVETMVAIFRGTDRMSHINFNRIHKISEYFEKISEKRQLQRKKQSMIDVSVIEHQVPGGMVSNMIMQLEQQNAIDRFEDVLLEIPKIRKEMGWPPLVTPMSQIIGTQAVFNVISGKRYKLIPREIKDYLSGLYGKPPGEIDPKLMKIAGVEKLDTSTRPADRLEPVLAKSEKALSKKGFKYDELDVITYSLFPDVAVEFFQKREAGELSGAAIASAVVSAGSDRLSQLSSICDTLSGTALTEFVWEGNLGKVTIKRNHVADNNPHPETVMEDEEPEKGSVPKKDMVRSGMVGVFRFGESMGRGDIVEKGQVIGFIESMRLKHEVRAENRFRLVDILVQEREPVEYDQPIFVIEPY
ncbi:MAG: pyruvate carboxylase subunit B [Nitrospinota bacterium]